MTPISKLNLRVLIYLNPSCVDKVTHKINLESDSGWCMVKDTILEMNQICDYHFYVLFPCDHLSQGPIEIWGDKPENVTFVLYPYTNDALTNRYHFDVNALSKFFNCYRHDIDLVFTMLPENVASLKAFMNKRREEVPIVAVCNWMDAKKNASYEPEYKYRMLEGAVEANIILLQSQHHVGVFKKIISGISDIDLEQKIGVLNPKACQPRLPGSIGSEIAFPHRVSVVSGFKVMWDLCRDRLHLPIWVTNINKAPLSVHPKLIIKHYHNKDDFYERLANVRFGISYHIGYSMWSISVLEMMALGKCVLAPRKNAFPEMFDEEYPFLFDTEKGFLENLEYMQSPEAEDDLAYWGRNNLQRYLQRFTYQKQSVELINLFESLVLEASRTPKAKSVERVVRECGTITKQKLLNKGMTDFGRLGSRAWNKARIGLMRNGIKDNIKNSETEFYVEDK